jgi:hypothetical protein
MHQRHDIRGGSDRRLAGGIGRIASQTVNPVYPRKHDQDNSRRRDGKQPQATYFVDGGDGSFGHLKKALW